MNDLQFSAAIVTLLSSCPNKSLKILQLIQNAGTLTGVWRTRLQHN